MQLIPAIDIRDGRCVRLYKGDFDEETRYEFDPVALTVRYRDLGAAWLHIVDLDGAKNGSPVHLDLIRRMKSDGQLKLQFGGGIRTAESLAKALEVADRVVVGSLAAGDPELVSGWLEEHGAERITLGLDVRIDAAGMARLTTHAWTRLSDITLDDALRTFSGAGLVHVLCTDVERDGAMQGPNVGLYSAYCRQWPKIAFQASGGIRNSADIDELTRTGVASAISGRALLDGTVTDAEIRRFLQNA